MQTSKIITLPNKDPLKVSEIPKMLARALLPKVAEFNNGRWSENPAQLRLLEEKDLQEDIKELFWTGELTLLNFIGKRPILKHKARTYLNPLDLFIGFDEFVRFAELQGVTVTIDTKKCEEQFLTVREVAELVIKSGDKAVTDENILEEAGRWIGYCLSGFVEFEIRRGNVADYASELEAAANLYVVNLKSAVALIEKLNIPAQELVELGQVSGDIDGNEQERHCLQIIETSEKPQDATKGINARRLKNFEEHKSKLNLDGKKEDIYRQLKELEDKQPEPDKRLWHVSKSTLDKDFWPLTGIKKEPGTLPTNK